MIAEKHPPLIVIPFIHIRFSLNIHPIFVLHEINLSNEREAWVEQDLCLSFYLLDSGVWREINSAKESL